VIVPAASRTAYGSAVRVNRSSSSRTWSTGPRGADPASRHSYQQQAHSTGHRCYRFVGQNASGRDSSYPALETRWNPDPRETSARSTGTERNCARPRRTPQGEPLALPSGSSSIKQSTTATGRSDRWTIFSGTFTRLRPSPHDGRSGCRIEADRLSSALGSHCRRFSAA